MFISSPGERITGISKMFNLVYVSKIPSKLSKVVISHQFQRPDLMLWEFVYKVLSEMKQIIGDSVPSAFQCRCLTHDKNVKLSFHFLIKIYIGVVSEE